MKKDMRDKPDEYWKEKLDPKSYKVLRDGKTERPFSGDYVDYDEDGTYKCKACGNKLFDSDTKFKSGSGWPSYYDVIEEGQIELKDDTRFGMKRTEVVCARCGSHLGHVFEDGPKPTGKRYCINSCALDFEPK